MITTQGKGAHEYPKPIREYHQGSVGVAGNTSQGRSHPAPEEEYLPDEATRPREASADAVAAIANTE